MEEDKKITKIVIGRDDELTDIISGILDSSNERILVTFAEESDLLISPINLKVILETADERDKSIIAQIIKNPTGIRNASLAGLTTVDTPNYPSDEMWEKEMINRARRYNPLGKRVEKEQEPEVVEKNDNHFQEKVDSVIEKSKNDDILITFDEDIASMEDVPVQAMENDIPKLEPMNNDKMEEKESPIKEVGTKILPFFGKIKDFFLNIKYPPKLKRIAPIVGLSILIVAILSGVIYYNTVPFVKVRIYVEAKEANIEKVFQGDENIKAVDFENSKIPIKTENVEKSRSTNIKATGKAFRGEKAKGKVNVAYVKVGGCTDVSPLSLPAGHLITSSSSGQSFKIDSATSVNCNNISETAVTAIEVGEEYNLSSGQHFSVQGFSSNEVYAMNSSGAFTGGSKEEYTILSQADINSGVDELKKIAFEEGEQELKEKDGGWEIIPDSISSAVIKDSTNTDKAVGVEASDVNLSIKTKSSATYFLKEGFDEGIASLLTKDAQEKNLFASDINQELTLGENIEKSITVAQNNKNGIKIKLVAKGSVKPKVNKEDITAKVKGMKWEEGNAYLKTLLFSEKETEVGFKPENFPAGLRHFPKRQGGVLVEIKEVL
ncbi:MAG: hypothetical protein AB9915_01620 [Candidatus Dojkabacteria bacterium]